MSDKDFKFGDGRSNPKARLETENTAIFDRLIDGAGGKALPGRWGLVQAVLALWAPDLSERFPVIPHVKNGLMTAGLVKAYQDSKKQTIRKKKKHPLVKWILDSGMDVVQDASSLAHLIFVYAKELDYEDFYPPTEPGEEDTFGKDFIRMFKMPSGMEFCFWVYKSSALSGGREGINAGPYTHSKDGQHTRFMDEIRELIWNANGGSDLQLSAIKSNLYANDYDEGYVYRLENIGEPGDFVSGEGTLNSLGRLTDRVSKLKEKGISRNILFYGPPGTGKTSLARNLAREIGSGRALRVDIKAIQHTGLSSIAEFVRLLRPRVLLVDDIDREKSCH